MPQPENEPVNGFLETANPETGASELMGFWLPEGVTAAGLGLVRVIMESEGDQ